MLRLLNRTNSMLNSHCKFFSQPETEGLKIKSKSKLKNPIIKYLPPEIITIYITSINAVNITSNLVAGPEFRWPHRVTIPSNVTNAVSDTAQSATAAPPRHLRG